MNMIAVHIFKHDHHISWDEATVSTTVFCEQIKTDCVEEDNVQNDATIHIEVCWHDYKEELCH